MADLRINRRAQGIMQMKTSKRDNLAIPEEDAEEDEDPKLDKAIITKSKDATVEVTVKVKRRRDKRTDLDREMVPYTERAYRKGSWGDLLAGSRTNLACKDDVRTNDVTDAEAESDKKKKFLEKAIRKLDPSEMAKLGRRSDDHSPLCQKIPITKDLYLETHTHIRKSRSGSRERSPKSRGTTATGRSSSRTSRHTNTALLRENKELRNEIDRLREEMEGSRPSTKYDKCQGSSKVPAEVSCDDDDFQVNKFQRSSSAQGRAQGTQTSRVCLIQSPRKNESTFTSRKTETDGGPTSPPKKLVAAAASTSTTGTLVAPDLTQLENLRLEKENEALRREASQLLAEMNKTRQEYLECCNTMKELYQIAENLKRDNNSLLQNHQQQQSLQSKLLQTLSENREMKEFLEAVLAEKQRSSEGFQEGELAHIRTVVQDVKRAIAEEMQEFATQPFPTGTPRRNDNVSNTTDSAFRLDAFLNDTNASEIQRILGTEPPEVRRGEILQEDRSSSTQYLGIGALSSVESHYIPSPMAVSKFSPRISTPNSSLESLSLSEASVRSVQGFQVKEAALIPKPPVQESEWKHLQEQIARSFVPVRNEVSDDSTSSYSGSMSSSTSPNPTT